MAVVPEKVLRWLHGVLGNEYHHVQPTYQDVVNTLSKLPSLQPRTQIYTYENGVSALLLQLHGTIPVQFRQNVYRFPIKLWIPHAYPRQPPIAFVAPSPGMLIRPGQYVSGEGRIYHPYLANWESFWDKSSLNDFLEALKDVFAKEPPVIAEQQARPSSQIQPQQQPLASTPSGYMNNTTSQAGSPSGPRPPPHPQSLMQPPIPQSIGSLSQEGGAPPRPPKSEDVSHRPSSRYTNGSSLPPLPPKQEAGSRYQRPAPLPPVDRYPSPQQFRPQSYPAPQPGQQTPHFSGYQQRSPALNGPASPINRSVYSPQSQQYPLNQPHLQPPSAGRQPVGPSAAIAPAQYLQHAATYSPHGQQRQTVPQQPTQHHPQYQQYPPQQSPAPKQPSIDLLSSPLDVTLPSQTGTQEPLPVPAVPPNPQKDALLQALSQSLVSQSRQTLESSQAAIAPLIAQQNALRNAHATLQNESEQLKYLNAALDSNQGILRDTMARADAIMRDAAQKPKPNIDDLLVCPTIVGSQLYALVAAVSACQDTRVSLGKGLDRGRISADVFVKCMRQIGREEFLKKALVRKVVKGMGLEDGRR